VATKSRVQWIESFSQNVRPRRCDSAPSEVQVKLALGYNFGEVQRSRGDVRVNDNIRV